MAFTGRDIFTAVCFWGWALGQAGVMDTAGASIASVKAAAEAIAAAAEKWPTAAVLRVVAGKDIPVEGFATAERPAATLRLLIPAERLPAQAGPQRHAPAVVVVTRQLRTPAHPMRRQRVAAAVVMPAAVAVVVMPVAAVVVVMPVAAADTGNLAVA
jgi:hypothetical protein